MRIWIGSLKPRCSFPLTTFEVLLSETAGCQLDDLPPDIQIHTKATLGKLKNDPYRSGSKADIKKLKGPKRDHYRSRIGNYRALYVVEGYKVKVAKVLHRSKVHNWIE